jgi:hypothetical protein
MRNPYPVRIILSCLALIGASLACSMPGSSDTTGLDLAVEQTVQAHEAMSAQTTPTPAGDESPPPSSPSQPEQESLEESDSAPEPTPTPEIIHLVIPSNPSSVTNWIVDRSSADLAAERRAIGDNFDVSLYERPFTSMEMEYQAHLDITRAELSVSSPWIYITIYLEGSPPIGSSAQYSVELDLDVDGRGDWLITGRAPSSTDWTTDHVYALKDGDHDVGGMIPLQADPPIPGRTGYETGVFDQGVGPDPDAAWIRTHPAYGDRIQIAFKHALIGSDSHFLWGAWSDEIVQKPEWFDYNDHFTLAEAGSPTLASNDYPIKALALVDNTCRWAFGFTPTGSEPGICYVPTPTPTPQPGRIHGIVWRDNNSNGVMDPGETGLSGTAVLLGEGACLTAGFAGTSTASDGSFSFEEIPAGTYCVGVVLPSGCGGFTATTAHPRTITIDPGESSGEILLGFYENPC